MTSPEYQAPTWVNEDDPDFIEGVSPDLGAGYLNQLSGAVEDHGQRLGAAESDVANLQATALDQADGDARYILQSNANAFAPADATTTALAGKVGIGDARLTDTRVPTDASVTDAKVASSAAISADKLADGTTNKVLTAAERTKLAGVATSATANSTDAQLRDRSTHTGTQSADTITDGTTNHAFTAADDTKLGGIAAAATANSTDATLLARANHTGAQAISTVTGLQGALDAKAPLASPAFTGTPTGITKAHVGLGNVDNTSDAAKPVSTAQQTALDAKAAITTATTITTAGATQTLTAPTTGDIWYDLTLTAATCTLTLAGGTAGKAATIYLRVRQDATGARAVAFPGSVAWPQGLTPTLSALPNALDVFALTTTDGGTTWTGAILGPDTGALTQQQADARYSRIVSGSNVNAADMGNLKGLAIDPRIANGTRALVAGVLYCIKIKVAPGETINNLWYNVTTAAAGQANIYFAFYDQTGALLVATGNLAGGSPYSLGSKTQAVPSFTVPADGVVIATLLIGTATTVPVLTSGPGAGTGLTWGQDGTKGYPYFAYGTALTAPPAALTLNSTNCTIAAPGQSAILLALS